MGVSLAGVSLDCPGCKKSSTSVVTSPSSGLGTRVGLMGPSTTAAVCTTSGSVAGVVLLSILVHSVESVLKECCGLSLMSP